MVDEVVGATGQKKYAVAYYGAVAVVKEAAQPLSLRHRPLQVVAVQQPQ